MEQVRRRRLHRSLGRLVRLRNSLLGEEANSGASGHPLLPLTGLPASGSLFVTA
ncbi:hypothetical protein PVK74_30570 [Micromonospora chalcea]|uniref:hypothetical protein n=1 Tax=Micromonospora chalcea TaxID=1874 RepID=UPI00237939F6|nr:hypothetical protein [Micromonospora chalcea]WDQ00115.1 hypothetical protein PVK74_30570 [Micromonospora chalcea]